ncbi:MAG: GrpB family protein [Halomonas sp.]|nr:GrpB family protein [Halomonas sp.]TVP46635.1 MAG: GrpB family protein [Halomonas sp.]
MDEAESLNRAINEEIVLCPYSAVWPILFEEERARLVHLFSNRLVAIEHIGSTAVPGLSAKPVIDILAGVDSMAQADALIKPLCDSRYTTSLAYNATLTDRRWLMRWANGRRTHHLHLMVYGSEVWNQRLAFRNCLRESAELAQQYEMNKRQWAAEFKTDREAYTAAKGEFIQRALRSASQSSL